MSEIKVSQMPEASNVNDNDLVMIVQGGYNKKVPVELFDIPKKAHQVNVATSVDTDYKVNMIKTKNLFDENDTSERFNGNIADTSATTITPATYTYIVYIPVKSNTTYAITKVKCASTNIFRVADTTTIPAQNVAISNVEDFSTETIGIHTTNSTAKYMAIAIIQTNITTTTLKEVLDSIQIEEGSTATTYEPFIQNEININNEKYSDTINVGAEEDNRSKVNVLKSKQLFDKNSAPVLQAYVDNSQVGTSANARTTYIPCKPSTTYTIQKRNDGTQNRFVVATTTTIPANGVSVSQYTANNDASSITITTNSTAKYLVIQFYHVNETIYTEQQALDSIMINEGSTALPYEPYVVPSIKVNGDELYKKPKVLWETTTRTPTGDINLYDDITNYNYLEILYMDNNGINGSTKVAVELNRKVDISLLYSENNAMYMKQKSITLKQNKIEQTSYLVGVISSSGTASTNTGNTIGIMKVIGY